MDMEESRSYYLTGTVLTQIAPTSTIEHHSGGLLFMDTKELSSYSWAGRMSTLIVLMMAGYHSELPLSRNMKEWLVWRFREYGGEFRGSMYWCGC
jgi:hypothetical protein